MPYFNFYYNKAIYKFLLKEFYKRTNKNKNFKLQILEYNIYQIKLKAIDNLLIFYYSYRYTASKELLDIYIIQPTKIKKIFLLFKPRLKIKAIARYSLNLRVQ